MSIWSDARKLAGLRPALLEDWYRNNYFNNEIDISGSGVEEYSIGEIARISGFSINEIEDLTLVDGSTIGSIEIRKQIADRFGTGDPEQVMITNGANEALDLVVRSLLRPKDKIVTLGPCYHCHDQIAMAMGCEVSKWDLDISQQPRPIIDQLISLISSETRALILNFPHNPTGTVIDQRFLDEVIEIIEAHSIYLVWDGVFQQLDYDNTLPKDPIHAYKNTISIGSMSKAFGAPGLRLGWLIAGREIIHSCVRQKDYGNLFVAPLQELVGRMLLHKLEDFSAPRLEQAKYNRSLVQTWVDENSESLSWVTPQGGVCGLVNLPNGVNDIDFCEGLLVDKGVLLVPGSCFGTPGTVRLGFGGSSKKLKEGLRRTAQYIKEGKV